MTDMLKSFHHHGSADFHKQVGAGCCFQEWPVFESGICRVVFEPEVWPLIDQGGRASLTSVETIVEQCLVLVMKDSFQLFAREVESGRVRPSWN
jgi:hypothetical protein